MKKCSDGRGCGKSTLQSLKYFHKNSSSSDGFRSNCKTCVNLINKLSHEKHKEQRNQTKRLKKYQLTSDQFQQMFELQKDKCAINGCNNQIEAKDRETHVDHNHNTGKVRGVLCRGCNRALGFINEDITRLYGLIEYLNKNNDIEPVT